MVKHQRRSGRVKRRQPRCRQFESFGPEFFFIIIFFFALYIMKKNYFCNRKHFLSLKKRNRLKIEGNVGTAFDLSFLSSLIFSDPIEIRLGSVSVLQYLKIWSNAHGLPRNWHQTDIFNNVNGVCFPVTLMWKKCICNGVSFIKCAWCEVTLCFKCFYDEYHLKSCKKQ